LEPTLFNRQDAKVAKPIMNILLPIIRRKRRPLIEEDVQPVVAVPQAPPAPVEPQEPPAPPVLVENMMPPAPVELPQPKRKKNNAPAADH
jgi:hypothetical protein